MNGGVMTINVRVLAVDELVGSNVTDPLDFERAKMIFRRVVESIDGTRDQRIMLDSRNLNSELPVGAMWHLAAELVQYAPAFSGRTALLTRPERLEHMRFLALSAQNRGFAFEAFDNYEEAFAWLVEDQPQREKPWLSH